MQANTSDKCYVYFDVYEQTIAELCVGKTFDTCIKEEVYTSDGENGLYYHDGIGSYENADLEAGDNSYRYSGNNPNNYVCFGSNEEVCPADNLYRIIGVFENQVKLIKSDFAGESTLGAKPASPGSISLNTSPTWYWTGSYESNSNIWSESKFNTEILNGTYLDTLGSEWSDKIATTQWKVGGNTWANIGKQNVLIAYQNEIVNPAETTTYSAKVGLMYVSDYGYGQRANYWDVILMSLRTASWFFDGEREWTITRASDYSDGIFNTDHNANINGLILSQGEKALAIRPVFYLNSDVQYISGSGTESDPFRIA